MKKLSPSECKHIIVQEVLHKKKSKKLCILSHYDAENKIDDYVCYMLKELYKLNFDIIMVSTSKFISKIERRKVNKYLRAFILKKNSGYDFFSWKVGMDVCNDFAIYDELLLLNDSMFFPLTNVKKIFDAMKPKKYDFFGLLDSYNRRYHIQSFFWFFNKKMKKSLFFSSFWNRCSALEDKNQIINQYETMFTSLATNNGFRVGSYIETKKVRLDLLNKGIFIPEDEILFYSLWQFIIIKFHAPLLKKNMLCSSHQDFNPLTYYWKDIIDDNTSYDSRLITKYLARCQQVNVKDKFNWIEILRKLVQQILVLKDEHCKIVIYGYAYVGKLVYSILKDSVTLVIDRNYEYLNTINSVEIFPVDKILDIQYDKILICSFGREKEVGNLLGNYNIENNKIINLENILDIETLAFSNFITKLLKFFHEVSYLKVLDIEFQFYKTNMSIVEAINNYFQLLNIETLGVYECKEHVDQDLICLINTKTLDIYDIGNML